MNKRRLKVLWSFLDGKRRLVAGSMISAVLSVAFRFMSPIIIAFTLDSVLGKEPMDLPPFLVNIINNIANYFSSIYNHG